MCDNVIEQNDLITINKTHTVTFVPPTLDFSIRTVATGVLSRFSSTKSQSKSSVVSHSLVICKIQYSVTQ